MAARAAVDREGLTDMSEAWLATDEVDLLTWQGRWIEADAVATRMIDRQVAPSPLAWHLLVRGQLRVRSGRIDEGERDLVAALAIRPRVEPEIRAMAFGTLAEGALSRRDPPRALQRIREALAVLDATDEVPGRAHLLALGLRAAADVAERAEARRDDAGVAEAAAAAEVFVAGLEAARAGVLVDGGAADGRVASRVAWGFAEESRRTGSSDPEAWLDAAARLVGVGEPYLAAMCRYRAAEAMLARAGDRARAQQLLRDARDWTDRAGASPLCRAIEGLARRARLDVCVGPSPDATHPSGSTIAPAALPSDADAVSADPYRLSPREREVLTLLAEGRTNREIGALLFITEKTASSHVTHILDKLGVPSRTAAAALAARGGMIGGPPG
jgi:DNA-binding CsgD family transcriptional regulator